jgi:hypothetical protein
MGVETNTGKFKIGNGSTVWNSLPYGTADLALQPKVMTFEAQSSSPAVPDANTVVLYCQPSASRYMPAWIDNSAIISHFQPNLFSNQCVFIVPGSTTTPTSFAYPYTVAGTVDHPVLSSASLRESLSRFTLTTASTAASPSEIRGSTLRLFRGDEPGRGGFYFSGTFVSNTVVSGQQVFVGLTGSVAAGSGAGTPSAMNASGFFGFGWDSADTNLQCFHGASASLKTKIDLGAEFPANSNTSVYSVSLFAPPFANYVVYQATRMDNGATVSGTITNKVNMPVGSIFMNMRAYINNGATAAAATLDVMCLYAESDN